MNLGIDMALLHAADPQVAEAIEQELGRQRSHIELIASENFVDPAVLAAAGSVLTNKYAEGYPGRRYYGGCQYVDMVEELARERAKELFGAEHANVQPHAGSQANIAVYNAVLQEGDTILGMDLSHGGHLTHGSPVNFSGRHYHVVPYGVEKESEQLDYDHVRQITLQCHPKLIVAGASAYPRALDFQAFADIAKECGALLMVDMAHIAGLVAAGVHESPVPYADIVTTTTHKTLRGPRGGMILCKKELAKQIDKAIFPGTQGGPLMHIIAAKAVCLAQAMKPEFKAYGRQIVKNAAVLADSLMAEGIRLVSGGTDNHLMLADVGAAGRTGKEVEQWLDRAHITANKNTIPFETLSPMITSGVRLGTPAVTTRGMKEPQMKVIAHGIARIVKEGEGAIDGVRAQVEALCEQFPLY